jgi:hypothetical protein
MSTKGLKSRRVNQTQMRRFDWRIQPNGKKFNIDSLNESESNGMPEDFLVVSDVEGYLYRLPLHVYNMFTATVGKITQELEGDMELYPKSFEILNSEEAVNSWDGGPEFSRDFYNDGAMIGEDDIFDTKSIKEHGAQPLQLYAVRTKF